MVKIWIFFSTGTDSEGWAPGPPLFSCFRFLPPSLSLGSPGPPTYREIKNAPPSLYSYQFLLLRLQGQLREDHPSHPSLRSDGARAGRTHVPPPQLARVGGRRVSVVNFGAICAALKREPAHVQSFVLAELATTGALDGQGEALSVLASLQPKHVEQLLRKYVHAYVVCQQCKSLDTALERPRGAHELTLCCHCCHATRLVAPVKSGFQAVRRGERRANRV